MLRIRHAIAVSLGLSFAAMSTATYALQDGPLSEIDNLRRITPPIKPVFIQFADSQIGVPLNNMQDLNNLGMRLREKGDQVVIYSVAAADVRDDQDALKLSFSRALLVRNMLIEQGARMDQVDLEAMPMAADDTPHPDDMTSKGHWIYIVDAKSVDRKPANKR